MKLFIHFVMLLYYQKIPLFIYIFCVQALFLISFVFAQTGPKKLERESWMLELPEDRPLVGLGLQAKSQFAKKAKKEEKREEKKEEL